MLTVTESAVAHLAALLDLPQLQTHDVVRLIIEESGVQMEPARQEPGDVIFKHEERTVLVLEESVSQRLKGFTLDVVEESGESRLMVMPNHS
jgi:Fe-S cluster assembly iron-binding protein IscA